MGMVVGNLVEKGDKYARWNALKLTNQKQQRNTETAPVSPITVVCKT